MHFWGRVSMGFAAVALAASAGCASGTTTSGDVRALGTDGSPPSIAPSGRTHATDPSTSRDHTPPDNTTPAGAGDQPTTTLLPDGSEERGTVQRVLDRYDRAITALNADPSALMRPGDALVTGLDAVVPSSTVLAADVRAAVAERLAEGERVRPPDEGTVSWVHHATAISGSAPSPGSGEITFDWCSWSPGVATDSTSGTVTDDAVGHATGTGTITSTGADWVLTSLDQLSIEVLPSGSQDPCPGAQR